MTPIIDSQKLLAFTTLARTGSFTRTASELHLTQSAVSHAIKSLEQEFECRLCERKPRKVTLTSAGSQLLASALPIVEEMRAVRERLQLFAQPGSIV